MAGQCSFESQRGHDDIVMALNSNGCCPAAWQGRAVEALQLVLDESSEQVRLIFCDEYQLAHVIKLTLEVALLWQLSMHAHRIRLAVEIIHSELTLHSMLRLWYCRVNVCVNCSSSARSSTLSSQKYTRDTRQEDMVS